MGHSLVKPNERWVDKGHNFDNRLMKSRIEKSVVEMYSTHNEGKSVLAKKFIKILKKKIYKYMTSCAYGWIIWYSS